MKTLQSFNKEKKTFRLPSQFDDSHISVYIHEKYKIKKNKKVQLIIPYMVCYF